MPIPKTGNLEKWADEGVLLLNASLTVRANIAASHSSIGWHQFTDAAIRALSEKKEHLVFLLWGSHAIAKEGLIDHSKHLILKTVYIQPMNYTLKNESDISEDFAKKGAAGLVPNVSPVGCRG